MLAQLLASWLPSLAVLPSGLLLIGRSEIGVTSNQQDTEHVNVDEDLNSPARVKSGVVLNVWSAEKRKQRIRGNCRLPPL